MTKIFAALAVCSLCACSQAHMQVAPVVAPVAAVAAPITVETNEKLEVTALPCTDDLDCAKKITGLCSNGFSGTRSLQAENSRRVGIMVRCITDAEVAQQKAEEAAWKQQVAERAAARAAEAAKKPVKK
jgi:hypothetical protein